MKVYRPIWIPFYRPHLVAQLIITFVSRSSKDRSRADVHSRFISSLADGLSEQLCKEDLLEAVRSLFRVP